MKSGKYLRMNESRERGEIDLLGLAKAGFGVYKQAQFDKMVTNYYSDWSNAIKEGREQIPTLIESPKEEIVYGEDKSSEAEKMANNILNDPEYNQIKYGSGDSWMEEFGKLNSSDFINPITGEHIDPFMDKLAGGLTLGGIDPFNVGYGDMSDAVITPEIREIIQQRIDSEARQWEYYNNVNESIKDLNNGESKIGKKLENGEIEINKNDPGVKKLREYFESRNEAVKNLTKEDAQEIRRNETEEWGAIVKKYLIDNITGFEGMSDKSKLKAVAQILEYSGAMYDSALRLKAGEDRFGYDFNQGSSDCITSFKFMNYVLGNNFPYVDNGVVRTVLPYIAPIVSWGRLEDNREVKDYSTQDIVNEINKKIEAGDGIFFGIKKYKDDYSRMLGVYYKVDWEHVVTGLGDGSVFNANSDKNKLEIRDLYGYIDRYKKQRDLIILIGRYKKNK